MDRDRGSQTAVFMPREIFDIQDAADSTFAMDAKHPFRHFEKKNKIGLPDDTQVVDSLKKENQRLKALINDLIHDKACQARRIKELHAEKSQLKKTIAELMTRNVTYR